MIDRATQSDRDPILDITAQIGIFSATDKECVQELWDAYIDHGESSGYIFCVYRREGLALGYVCYGPTPLTVGTWDIYWLAVSPQHRREGIARTLMAGAEDRIAQQGGRLIVIETSGTDEYRGTRRFYMACGYRRQATIRGFYAPGDDLVIYGKTLASA